MAFDTSTKENAETLAKLLYASIDPEFAIICKKNIEENFNMKRFVAAFENHPRPQRQPSSLGVGLV